MLGVSEEGRWREDRGKGMKDSDTPTKECGSQYCEHSISWLKEIF